MSEGLVMKQMWQDVEIRFKERTNTSLRLNPPKSLNDCLAEIQKRQQPDNATGASTKAPTVDRAKQAGLDVLYCLKLLGGVAAQGASMVFAPASLCFNALSLLLDVPATIHNFHGAIDGLFETLGPSLSIFRIYDKVEQFDEIEPELKQAIHKLMIAFVDICALSIKLRNSGKWKSFKSGMKKVLLDNDSGVSEEIERFQQLTAAHSSIQGTQTLKTLLDTNSVVVEVLNKASETGKQTKDIHLAVVGLKESDDKRRTDEKAHQILESVRKSLDPDQNATLASRKRRDQLFQESVENTASFLLEDPDKHPEFHAWTDRSATNAVAMFSVTGGPNTGKSYIVSAIVQHLQSLYGSSSSQSTRTLVTSYFFPKNRVKTNSDGSLVDPERTDGKPVETALKSIALQLAEAETAYAKKIATDLKEKEKEKENVEKFLKDASISKLWEFLALGSPMGNTMHYIILDGLTALPDAYAESRDEFFTIMESVSSSSSSVRILISTKQSLANRWKAGSYSNVDVEEYSKDDIRRYVDKELKASEILQDSDPETTKIRDRIRDRLSTEVAGNYSKVNSALARIKAIVANDGTESALDQVLDESRKSEKAISNALIRSREQSFRSEEIDELNLLLKWIVYPWRWFEVAELNCALVLHSKTRSFLPLQKKLKGKYADFLEISNDGLVLTADGIEDLIKVESTAPRITDDTPKFNLSVTITNADGASVQSFLWNALQKASHDNFGFESVEMSKSAKKRISINEFESHLHIVRSTFMLLAQAPEDKAQTLLTYLLNYLPQHLEALEKATGFDALTPTEKHEIGDGLFLLFYKGDQIESHWKSCTELIWYWTTKEMTVFLRWLKDPLVINHLGRLDRDWLRDTSEDANPPRALLANITAMVARHWLRDKDWDVELPYKWLLNHYQNIILPKKDNGQTGNVEKGEDSKEDSGSDRGQESEQISMSAVAEWCRSLLNVQEVDLLWNERVASTHLNEGEWTEAVKMIEAILETGGPNVTWSEKLASAYSHNSNQVEACRIMEEVVLTLVEQEPIEESRLAQDYRNLCSWYLELDRHKQALECISRAREILPKDSSVLSKLLETLLTDKDEARVTQLLHDLSGEASEPLQQTLLGQVLEMVVYTSSEEELGLLQSVITRQPKLLDESVQELNKAITSAKEKSDAFRLGELLLYKGMLTHEVTTEGTLQHGLALECWNECLRIDNEYGWSRSMELATSLVCSHHLDAARLARDDEVRKRHLNDLESIGNLVNSKDTDVARQFLAAYYTLFDDRDKSKLGIQKQMTTGFNLLADSVVANDWFGYYSLAVGLLKSGDTLNALSAYSLLLPVPAKGNVLEWLLDFDDGPEYELSRELITATAATVGKEVTLRDQIATVWSEIKRRVEADEAKSTENTDDNDTASLEKKIREKLSAFPMADGFSSFGFRCDGCGRTWDFENDINLCKYCYDLGFCNNCLQILKNGRLAAPPIRSLSCNRSHEWLNMPKWDRDNYLEPLRGNVWVGGTLQDSARIGGELITIQSWLDGLKKEWGYEDPVEDPDLVNDQT